MEHTAKLTRMPHGVQFPTDLDGKIVFDAARRCLVWRGFMTEDELRELVELSGDPAYRRAVAGLFEVCNRIETPLTRRLNLTLAILVAMCLIGGVIVLVGVALQKSSLKHESQRHSEKSTRCFTATPSACPLDDVFHARAHADGVGVKRSETLKFLQGGHHA